MTNIGISHAEYDRDQKNAKRQSGTTKGKRAIRAFLKALDERFSEGAIGALDWHSGLPGVRSAMANNYFWKWIMEVPPWGTPEYNASVVTIFGIHTGVGEIPIVMMNSYGDSPEMLRIQARRLFSISRTAFAKALECRAGERELGRVFRKAKRSARKARTVKRRENVERFGNGGLGNVG
jgi:uncharacterized membrane protein